MNIGVYYGELGQPEQAEAAYRKALSLEPLFYCTLLNLGDLLAEEGRNAEAVSLYQKVIDDPRSEEYGWDQEAREKMQSALSAL